MTETDLYVNKGGGWRLWLHSLKVAQLLCSAACLHTNQSRSYLNHLVVLETKPMDRIMQADTI